jgi:hypothetical protein
VGESDRELDVLRARHLKGRRFERVFADPAPCILRDADALCSSEQGQIKPMTIQSGRWIKGQSGNPGGRPRIMRDVQALARQYSGQAVRTLGELMRSEATPPGVRVRAAELLLDRAWGRPLQASVSTNLDVRQLSDEELIAIISEGQAVPELPAPQIEDAA